MDASAIVLVGGKSSRMGQPKALLPFGGKPLIAHIVDTLRQLFPNLILVAAPGQDLPPLAAAVVSDDLPFQGPVGGIYYGLRAAAGEFAFVTSCDAPFLSVPLIANLTKQISDYDVVVPYWDNRFQPLHAVYRRSVAPLLAEQLERGELRPIALYDRVRTLRVTEDEIRRFDYEGLSFLNMNTPEDYAAALSRWRNFRQIETENRQGDRETRSSGEINTETAEAPHLSLSPGLPVSPSVCVTVELFGVARLVAKTREVGLTLPAGAVLSDVWRALAAEHPGLVGRVITADKTGLLSGYACNVNGMDFKRDPSSKLASTDKIFLISADAGG